MIKKTLLLSALLLVSSPIVYAEQALTNASVPENNLEAIKRNLLDTVLENIQKHEVSQTFYTNLSQEKKQELAELITGIEAIVNQAIAQMTTLGQAHKDLIEDYKQALKVKEFNFKIELSPVVES